MAYLPASSTEDTAMSVCLTPEELGLITGRTYLNAQLRTLGALGIDYDVHPDGSIHISTAHAEKLLGLKMKKAN